MVTLSETRKTTFLALRKARRLWTRTGQRSGRGHESRTTGRHRGGARPAPKMYTPIPQQALQNPARYRAMPSIQRQRWQRRARTFLRARSRDARFHDRRRRAPPILRPRGAGACGSTADVALGGGVCWARECGERGTRWRPDYGALLCFSLIWCCTVHSARVHAALCTL